MPTLLETILTEIEEVTEAQEDLAEPDEKPGPKDHVVGVANPHLRKLYFLIKQYKKRMFETGVACLLVDKKELKGKVEETDRLDMLADLIENIFWMSCRHVFPELWTKSAIGVRKGWHVVWSDRGEHSLGIFGAIPRDILEEMIRRSESDKTHNPTPDKSHLN